MTDKHPSEWDTILRDWLVKNCGNLSHSRCSIDSLARINANNIVIAHVYCPTWIDDDSNCVGYVQLSVACPQPDGSVVLRGSCYIDVVI